MDSREPIQILKKRDLATVTLKELEMKIFQEEKKPNMPDLFSNREVVPLKVFCSQVNMVNRRKFNDFQYIKEIKTKPNAQKFRGNNTKKMQETKQATKNKTKVIYKPLIKKTPYDPSTILTELCDIEATSHQAKQQVAVFTCDQQF